MSGLVKNQPSTTKPADVNLRQMAAIVLFVKMDELVCRLAYLTALAPLAGTVLFVRKAFEDIRTEEPKKHDPEDELFTPYGP